LDQDDGHGWFPRDASSLLTDGFGHGPLGVVYALRQLYAATMERRYAKAAGDALSSLYCCKTDTLSVLNNAFAGPHTWCRGFSGYIGALLRMLPDPKSDWLSGVIDNFVERAYNAHLLESDCVCHGELGNLDFSFGAEIQFSDRRWRSSAVQRAQQLLERASTEGWACGMPVPSPGLMDGFAGIGYQLLRMAAPHKVPSVLFLEPPIVSNGTTPIAPSDGRGCV
jgi:lantibiotic modifying enzyme